MSKLGPISHFLSPVSCDSLVLQGLRCEWGAGVLNLVLSLSLSHTGHWKFNMAPHCKELSEDLKKIIVALHKDGVGYKKVAKTLKLSCSTVAKTIQWFNRTGSTQNRPRHGRPKKLSAYAQRHIQRLCLGNRRMSAASIAAEVEGVGGSACQCSDHTPHTASNWFAWLSSQKEASSKDGCTRKPANSLMKTSRLRTWITGTMSCGLMRQRWTSLVQMVSSVCGGNQVRSTKTSVSCLQSSMVVGVSWSGAAWVLPHWGATVHWGNHECQHVLWHTEAEHDTLPIW